MPKITIVGLGPWEKGYLTEKAKKTMEAAYTVFRTEKHPEAAHFSGSKGFSSLDGLYAQAEDFAALNRAAASEVMRLASLHGAAVYAVPDSGSAGDSTVTELLRAAAGSFEIEMIPGVDESAPFLSQCCMKSPGSAEACAVVPAELIESYRLDRTMPLVVTQLDDRLLAGRVKLRLSGLYGDEAPVYFCLRGKLMEIKLEDIDRQPAYDRRTALMLKPSEGGQARYDFMDLVEIMDRLRGPGGCPWDREQTHESLKQYLLEECYEVIEAVEEGDMKELCEELGDVMLQVVFHARLAGERGDFDALDVTDGVCRKMILRHPHIFGDARADTPDQVVANWEAIKKREKGKDTEAGMMKRIPSTLPAVIRSMKVQEKAARVGFDWPDVQGAFEKLTEEVGELKEAISECLGEDKLKDEFGDVLFAAVNVARFIGVHPEFALKGTVEKFIRRFEYIEKRAAESNRNMNSMTLEEMDSYWNEAKALE